MNETLPGPGGPSPILVAEAAKRSGIVWIHIPGQASPRPAWHVWRTVTAPGPPGAGPPPPGAAYVVTGPGEQPLPGLGEARRVTVTVRGAAGGTGTDGAVVTWAATVDRVEPGGPEWDSIIGALVAGRLNPPAAKAEAEEDGPEISPAKRWARDGAVYRLTPVTAWPEQAPGGRRG